MGELSKCLALIEVLSVIDNTPILSHHWHQLHSTNKTSSLELRAAQQHSLAVQLMYDIKLKNGFWRAFYKDSLSVRRSAARQVFAFASLSLILPTKRHHVLAIDQTVAGVNERTTLFCVRVVPPLPLMVGRH